MRTVTVRNVVIGEGKPKICVPIVGVTKEEIIEDAGKLGRVSFDIVEWRADWFEHVFEIEYVREVLKELRAVLEDTPILFTFRTAKEGGEKAIAPGAYLKLNREVVATGYADLVDVEAFSGEEIVRAVIEEAHKYGVKVVVSNHDFEKTPGKDEIVARLRGMQELGADISKIAVMPQTKRDVLTLLGATEEMYTEYAEQPIVTMAMGKDGIISRLCGEIFGSAITFGAAGKASAPGQISVYALAEILEYLHEGVAKTEKPS